MEVKDYCRYADLELSAWKAKLYDVLSKIDQLPTANKQRMYEDVNGLHIVMAELDDRIEKLRKECSIAWRPGREEKKMKFPELNTKYNDTGDVSFDYDFGG